MQDRDWERLSGMGNVLHTDHIMDGEIEGREIVTVHAGVLVVKSRANARRTGVRVW